MTTPLMYSVHASWFHLLTSPVDYEQEARVYLDLVQGAATAPIQTLLEMGSGGGNNASWYKRDVPEVTLTDLSPDMLALSATINPECEHIQGDMRTLRLGRTFDAVFVHDAIMYLTSEDELAACFETAATHLEQGGVALFVPDWVRETFHEGTDTGGHDSSDGSRGLRYMEWTRDRDPEDNLYEVDYVYLLRDGDSVEAAHDHHNEGVFPEQTWRDLLDAAGFDVVLTRRMEWDGKLDSQVAFLAKKR